MYFYPSLAIKGGLEKILIDKMNYLVEHNDYEVFIITSDQNVHPLAYKLHYKVKHIDLNINFYYRFKYNIIKRLWLYIKMEHTYKSKASKIIKEVRPDILIFTTKSLYEMTIIKKLHYNLPIVVESHMARTAIETKRSFLSTIFYSYLKMKQENSIKDTSALVCLTKADTLLWKNIKAAVTIPNMINRPQLIKKINIINHRIICVGRISREKGYDLLIAAWRKIYMQYPQWHIDIYGSGDMEEVLLDQIKQYNLSNIYLKGISSNINEEYQKSDFLVLSSRFEGFGLVLAEAMACGIPCVAFDCPCGPCDILYHKTDGLLVENENVDKFANAIRWMMEHNEERLKMGVNAKKDIERFYPENIMPMWDNLFKNIVKNNRNKYEDN